MFPLRPRSWKLAGRANKQRGAAHARHTNTFTYVYSHRFQKNTHTRNYTPTLKELYMRLGATPSHIEEEDDVGAGEV